MVCIYNGKSFSLEEEENHAIATPWMDTEGILLKEISQTKKCRVMSLTCGV